MAPPRKTGRPRAKPTGAGGARAARVAAGKSAAIGGKRFRIPGSDRAVIDAMDELFGGRAELRKGAMFGCPGYFLGSKAVACVFGDALNVTLPPERIAELVARPGYRPFMAHGRAMTGWVLLDMDILSALDADSPLLDEAIAHARAKAARSPRGTPGARR